MERIFTSFYKSPLGLMTMASDGENLTGLWFSGQNFEKENLMNLKTEEREVQIFIQTKKWLDIYFSGSNPDFIPPLKFTGSDFYVAVMKKLLQIKFGEFTTYGKIAEDIAKDFKKNKMSAQAVGGAVGHNQIAIIVPCHRVLGKDKKLTGYAAGLDKKEFLLKLEKIL